MGPLLWREESVGPAHTHQLLFCLFMSAAHLTEHETLALGYCSLGIWSRVLAWAWSDEIGTGLITFVHSSHLCFPSRVCLVRISPLCVPSASSSQPLACIRIISVM